MRLYWSRKIKKSSFRQPVGKLYYKKVECVAFCQCYKCKVCCCTNVQCKYYVTVNHSSLYYRVLGRLCVVPMRWRLWHRTIGPLWRSACYLDLKALSVPVTKKYFLICEGTHFRSPLHQPSKKKVHREWNNAS